MLQHLASEFDLGLRLVLGGEALQCPAVVGKRDMQPMKLGEMPGQPLARVVRNTLVRFHQPNIECGP